MEPNKLEKEFKKKLEQRTIQPSGMAWDRLDAMLSVTEKKNNNRTWMYAAAGFIGFLLALTLFLKQGETGGESIITNEAVVTDKEHKEADNAPLGNEIIPAQAAPAVTEEAVAVSTSPAPALKKSGHREAALKEAHTPKELDFVPAFKKEAVAATEIKAQQAEPGEEANILLAEAHIDIEETKRPSVKVDAGALLSSVEGELDENFRTKVLQTVTKNYKAVRTSLATRNYQ